MNLLDQLGVAFKVVASWQALVSAGAFILLWSLLSYMADPYRSKDHKLPQLHLKVNKRPIPPRPARAARPAEADDEGELPDEEEPVR